MYTNHPNQMPGSAAPQPSSRRSRQKITSVTSATSLTFSPTKKRSKTIEKSFQSLLFERHFHRHIFSAQNSPRSEITVADQRASGENEVRICENELRKRENKMKIGETNLTFK
jgi:hypothetical protein